MLLDTRSRLVDRLQPKFEEDGMSAREACGSRKKLPRSLDRGTSPHQSSQAYSLLDAEPAGSLCHPWPHRSRRVASTLPLDITEYARTSFSPAQWFPGPPPGVLAQTSDGFLWLVRQPYFTGSTEFDLNESRLWALFRYPGSKPTAPTESHAGNLGRPEFTARLLKKPGSTSARLWLSADRG